MWEEHWEYSYTQTINIQWYFWDSVLFPCVSDDFLPEDGESNFWEHCCLSARIHGAASHRKV